VGGLPDGYVDLVSLDVTDAGATIPAVTSADPPDKGVNAGPVVNLTVALQDRITAVNTNSIQLFLDNALVSPSVQKVGTTQPFNMRQDFCPPFAHLRDCL
jgi:hypothetical protein